MTDPRIPQTRPQWPRYATATLSLWCLVMLLYVPLRPGSFNPQAWGLSLAFWLAELCSMLSLGFFILTGRHTAPRPHQPPGRGYCVDVLIPTMGEPVEVLRRTLWGALAIRYPHRTLLLDDSARPEVEALASSLGATYLARMNNIDAKAGNLNFGLAHSSAELVAILDADHIARPEFLDHLVGYFNDPELAFVQTPQSFYNLDSIQHFKTGPQRVVDEQALFFAAIQPGRDALGATLHCGSNAVLRRSALDAIGGFATGSITEDAYTGLLLQSRGYRSAYHPQVLASGLAPPDLQAFQRQRLRWAQGLFQVWRREPILRNPGLRAGQRLAYLGALFSHMEGLYKAVLYVLPGVSLLAGMAPVIAGPTLLTLMVAQIAISIMLALQLARRQTGVIAQEVFCMLRMPVAFQLLPKLFGRQARFHVTPKRTTGHNPLALSLPVLAILCVNLSGMLSAATASWESPGSQLALHWMTMFWAAFNSIIACATLHRIATSTGWQRQSHPFCFSGLARCHSAAGETSVTLAGLSPDQAWLDFDTLDIMPPAGALLEVAFSLGEVAYRVPAIAHRRAGRRLEVRIDLPRDKALAAQLERSIYLHCPLLQHARFEAGYAVGSHTNARKLHDEQPDSADFPPRPAV